MMKPGHTLIEILAVMAVLAILLAIAAPDLARWRDRTAARAARDELASRLAWTRIAAASHGGASLVLDIPGARYRVVVEGGAEVHSGDLERSFGVSLSSAGTRDTLVLRYDALGIGRTTGGTLQVRKGGAIAGLTINPYGRYRRW